MKRLLLFMIMSLISFAANAQLKGKIQEILSGDPFFKQLRETYNIVQGDEKQTVPHFLDKTLQNPKAVTITKFRMEKEKYLALCQEYNSIIDDITSDVMRFEKLIELREISLFSYKERIEAVQKKFKDYFIGLNSYHGEALLGMDILISVYKFAKPIIQHLIEVKVETIKRIIAEQLKALKLVPIDWGPTEQAVINGQGFTNREEISVKIGLKQVDHYRSLNLAPGSMMPQINAAYNKLKEEYTEEKTGTSNPEIEDFFSQLLERVDAAKKYFDSNPPQAPAQLIETKTAQREAVAQGNGGGCGEMKAQINGLLMAVDVLTKEQLVEKLQKVLEKY